MLTGLALGLFPAIGIYLWSKGQHQARYFLIAWVSLIVGGMITISMMLGYLPNNLWTTHASKIGSALEIVLLSFALADRIKILERAKNHAEALVKKELEERAVRLAESNRLKNDFLATISHEFRTPLNGILGSLELAADEHGKPQLNSLQDARNSARDMLDLVDNVLTYTELQAGNRIMSPETIELALEAAEAGVLVFAALNTGSPAHTLEHLIQAYPREQEAMIRGRLSQALNAIIAQRLARRPRASCRGDASLRGGTASSLHPPSAVPRLGASLFRFHRSSRVCGAPIRR